MQQAIRNRQGANEVTVRSALQRLLGFAALLLVAAAVQASPREIVAGEALALPPGHGVLAVAVDSTDALARVQLRGETREHGEIILSSLAPGRQITFHVVRAGAWRWHHVENGAGVGFPLGSDREYSFDVRPGVINYPGDFVYRPRQGRRALLHVANRGLGVLDRIERDHPALAGLHFDYRGHYPDPFPAFYRAQRGSASTPARAVTSAATPASLPVPVASLWRSPEIERASMDPSGQRLALVRRLPAGRSRIELADLAAPNRGRTVVLETEGAIRDLGWSGERRLIVSTANRGSDHAVTVVELHASPNGGTRIERRELPRDGRVVSLLPLDPDHLLFASRADRGHAVHRIDIRSRRTIAASSFRWEDRLNRGMDGEYTWLTDAQGRLRAATSAQPTGINVLYHGSDDGFAEVMRVDDEHGFQPLRLSRDGSLVYGLTEQQRGQRELVAFEPATGAMSTVFGREATDVMAPVFDLEQNLIGVRHYEHGLLQTHYFDDADRQVDAALRRALPERSITLVDRDRSGRHYIINVEGSDAPTRIYHYDRVADALTLVEYTRPWLAEVALAPTHVIEATAPDGLTVEAYLTLPAGDGPRPLVVMPHGGPIGIRNQRHFDPEAQFVASLGYAVLQVNFRGSTGFGRTFREAGHNQLGRGIEDDIDAALDAALARFPLDASRMCLVGSSYGGYSSLMSTLRAPGRFRCAAAISGFTDRVLQFTASDSGRSAEVRGLLETFIGNPNRELDAMTEGSPLYRFDQIDVPLLLAHGTEDIRVDYEHTRRLVRLLNLAGRSPTLVTLFGEGHSVETMANREKLWHAVAGFLQQHI